MRKILAFSIIVVLFFGVSDAFAAHTLRLQWVPQTQFAIYDMADRGFIKLLVLMQWVRAGKFGINSLQGRSGQ